MLYDIHSHILPAVDDGAKNIEESIKILEMLKEQGVSNVMATPHFYPQEDNFETFFQKIRLAYENLLKAIEGKSLPNIYLGCEMLYSRWGLSSDLIKSFCLNNSNYLLLELTDSDISPRLFIALAELEEEGIVPIIAHVERYQRAANFRKFLNLIKCEGIIVQVNAESFVEDFRYNKRILKKLITGNYFVVLGSDAHNIGDRAPLIKQALDVIGDTYGEEYRNKIELNTREVFEKIIAEGQANA